MSVKLTTTVPAETKEGVKKLQALADSLPDLIKAHDVDVPDCESDEGMAEADAHRKAMANARIEAEKLHKSAKAFFWNNGKLIDEAKNNIVSLSEPVELKFKSAINAVKTKRKEAEAARLQAIKDAEEALQAKLDAIKALENAVTLDDVLANIEKLDNLNLQEYGERADEAIELSESALEVLTKRKQELEALEKQRQEQAEVAEKLRQQQAEADAKAKELADREREINEKAEREAAAAKAKKDAEEKAERERIAAAEKAEADKQAAIENARREEQEKAAVEAKRIADEKAEAERLAALAPDIDKLEIYIDTLDNVEAPAMGEQVGKELLFSICEIHDAALREMAALVHRHKEIKAA